MNDPLTHLKIREAQAPVAAALINGYADRIGRKRALRIAERVISEDARLSGQMLAAHYGGNSLAVLAEIVKKVWTADNAMEAEFSIETDTELCFNVTRCGYAELYERLGIKDLGTLLSCGRDFAFLEGFNPDIKLRRTSTIMAGACCCDFHYLKLP
jgi:hypothetical protein